LEWARYILGIFYNSIWSTFTYLNHTYTNLNWSQSYDLEVCSYNASAVVGYSALQRRRKFFIIQNALGYSWRCKFLQRWRRNSKSYDWLQISDEKARPSQVKVFRVFLNIDPLRCYPRINKFVFCLTLSSEQDRTAGLHTYIHIYVCTYMWTSACSIN
jgi:hypothetical protein